MVAPGGVAIVLQYTYRHDNNYNFYLFIRLLSADEALHSMGCSIVNKITITDKRLERIQIKITEN